MCVFWLSRMPHYTVEQFQPQQSKLLQSISSLKHLHIQSNVKGKSLQLFNMLQQCPHLSQLDLLLNYPCKITCSPDHYPVCPMVRHLGFVSGPSSSDMVPQLFQHFSGLRVLRLVIPIASYEGMDMIRHYCPELQQLVLGRGYGTQDPEDDLLQQGELEGIGLLSIQSSSFHGDFMHCY